jgi:hypothetical protein
MLDNQHTVAPGAPVHVSQLDLDRLHTAIKQTYFELDQYLRKIVKDNSGCVCVGIKDSYFSKKEFIEIFR